MMDKIVKGGVKFFFLVICLVYFYPPLPIFADDLEQIREKGVLRHLAVPYANFAKLEKDGPSGMSVEIVRLFARHLGVRYQFVQSDWHRIIQELIGRDFVIRSNDDVEFLNASIPVKGDLICTGFTVLTWRNKLIAYSQPTFPTQIWVIARRGTIDEYKKVRNQPSELKSYIVSRNLSVLGKNDTCLDPSLYGLDKQGKSFGGSVNDLAQAVLEGEADVGILDCPDTLIALRSWPEKIAVLGPISEIQTMAAGFRPESKELRAEFDRFLLSIKKSGVYYRIVKKYYPDIFFYFPDAFKAVDMRND